MKNKLTVLGKMLASKHRPKILIELSKGVKMPSQISRATGLSVSYVSKILSGFVEMKVAECKTPELVKGRLYGLTSFGQEIANSLKDILDKEGDENHEK